MKYKVLIMAVLILGGLSFFLAISRESRSRQQRQLGVKKFQKRRIL